MKPRKKRRRPSPARRRAAAAVPRETRTYHTLEVVVGLTGLSPQSILHYQEQGLIAPVFVREGAGRFDDEALRTLRRIEHLRAHYEMSLRGLRLTLRLLQEVEQLEAALRARR